MPKTRAQKEETVKILTDKLGRAKSLVFADYRGLTMGQLSSLRNELRDLQAEFTITKNNLLKLALKDVDQKLATSNEQLFSGPTATLFAYDDEITPLKKLSKLLKDTQIGSIKLGILGGELLDATTISRLASLPSRDELRGKIVGSLGAPLYGIVGVLQANLRNLVYALEGIRISKGGETT